jgi:hypothetical protein
MLHTKTQQKKKRAMESFAIGEEFLCVEVGEFKVGECVLPRRSCRGEEVPLESCIDTSRQLHFPEGSSTSSTFKSLILLSCRTTSPELSPTPVKKKNKRHE